MTNSPATISLPGLHREKQKWLAHCFMATDLFHNRVWRWKFSSKLKCSPIATAYIGANKGFKLNSNRNRKPCYMFHFMVVKESQPYFYFIYILKFKPRWKLWLMIEVSLLLRLLNPAHFWGPCILGTYQMCAYVFLCLQHYFTKFPLLVFAVKFSWAILNQLVTILCGEVLEEWNLWYWYFRPVV